jgi:hypothetical protein
MATTEIEIRITALETEVSTLKNKLTELERPQAAWWREISGTFASDADYDEAMRLGREYRLSLKEEAK